MAALPTNSVNSMLGFPADARLLIINLDDFGFCNAINRGIMEVLNTGIVRSTSVMMTCPWAGQAIHYLHEHPEISVGVHLTAISDPAEYHWGPLQPSAKVSSLVDEAGFFYDFAGRHARMSEIELDQLELEFRAQIEAVLAAGLHPDHLDWHSLRIRDWAPIPALITRLGAEYGLAVRVMGEGWVNRVQGQGLPCIDRDFLDSYLIDPVIKAARYRQLLHELPAGLNEWAVHPGLDCEELITLEPEGNHFRQSDHDFWTSAEAKKLIDSEGITLVDYRLLQSFWRKDSPSFLIKRDKGDCYGIK
jgi:predicted glycoside hydrolase/deacetylase ChbG (UPF0249 family)